MKNVKFSVWEDAYSREEGFSVDYTTDEFKLNTIEEVKEYIIDLYECELIDRRGSIDVDEYNDDGIWLRTLYHISEDSDDELVKC